jgi:hypothetical protein
MIRTAIIVAGTVILARAAHGLVLAEPYGYAGIDYSAVNEYFQAHYGQPNNIPGSSYFPSDKHVNAVYNAREGILGRDESDTIITAASLATCGFQIVHTPTKISNWQDKAQLQEIYLAELRSVLVEELGGHDAIMHLEFYHPMLRGEDLTMTRKTEHNQDSLLSQSSTAAMAHIDTDIGAFEAERVLNLVESNRVASEQSHVFPRCELLDAIQKGHRFMIINCWRNAGESPIQRAPLGIYATRYKEPDTCFPTSQPDWDHSRWYLFPGMTKDECLLFKQYDRDIRFASDLWHCALHDLSVPLDEASLRRSLDIRAFVTMKERVDEKHDRYCDKRTRPFLTYQESEQFCRAQGVARQQRG